MSLSRHAVRLLLAVCLLVAGLPAGASAAPRPAARGTASSAAPSGAAGTTTFSPTAPLTPIPEPPESGKAEIDLEGLASFMERAEPILSDLQKSLDRSQFDLDALGARLEYDAATILGYLRSEIAFEQYPGVLRGELGTLVGRAGNAFDQALLARRLLDDAGYETRLVRATLSEGQARALVAEMARPRSPAPPAVEPAAAADLQRRLEVAAGVPPADAAAEAALEEYALTPDLVDGDVSLIMEGLRAAGVELGQSGAIDELVREARDYLWVQYRLSPYDKWTDAHPAWGSGSAVPAGLKIEQVYRDTLPVDLYHKLRLAVTIEQKLGDELVTAPVVTGWERTSAELFGRAVTFQQVPSNLDPAAPADVATLLKDPGLFIPIVEGKMAERAFDLRGFTYSVGLQGLGAVSAALLGTSVGGAAGQALGGLGGEEGAGAAALTAEWIDYTLVAPGGQETRFRRTVLDRVGEANRKAGRAEIAGTMPPAEAAKALLSTYVIVSLPGEYGPAYISHRSVERSYAEIKLQSYLRPDISLADLPVDLLAALAPLEDVVINSAFAKAIAPGSGMVAYRAAPGLVVYEQGLVAGKEQTAYERVDVMRNARRVLTTAGGTLAAAPEEALRIGVWETLAERAPMRGSGTRSSTPGAMRQAAAGGIPLVVLAPGDGGAVARLGHSEATKTAVQADLEAGYTVILPERPAAPGADTAWWRVNAATGETLGISSGGYGQDFTEYSIIYSWFIALIFFVASSASCIQSGGGAGCCIGANLALGAIGFGVGLGIGVAASAWISVPIKAWIASLVIGDLGLGVGGYLMNVGCTP